MENKPEICLCRSTTGLFIAKRQASWCLTAFLICLLLSFLTGYFWGRRQPIADLTEQLSTAVALKTDELDKLVGTSADKLTDTPDTNLSKASDSVGKDQALANSDSNTIAKQYYGTLLSFNNLKSAQKYLNKLQNSGYNLKIKTRHSRNSKNKKYTWYQIITENFTDKTKLAQLIQAIKQQENLPNTKIIEA